MLSEATAEFLTPPDVARLLGVDVSKVRVWITAGELRAANLAATIGSRPRWRIARGDLEGFLARRTCQAAPKATKRRRRKPGDFYDFYPD